jgi:hypothetical protein
VVRFGTVRQLRYKAAAAPNQTLFPEGLYFTDSMNVVLGTIDDDRVTILGGNGLSTRLTSGSVFSSDQPLGFEYAAQSMARFAFDSDGLPVFYTNTSGIFRVDADSAILAVLDGSTYFDDAVDGAQASTLNVNFHGAMSGIATDDRGNIYFGNRGHNEPVPVIGRADVAADQFFRVIGNNANAHSPDQSAGNARTANILCDGHGGCALGEYDLANDRLLFAEDNTIRFVTTPYDTTQSSLGTLLDAGQRVRAFVTLPTGFVYYISGGGLFCYDLNGVHPPECDNSLLGPPYQLGTLSSETLVRDDVGTLYTTNSAGNLIIRFRP